MPGRVLEIGSQDINGTVRQYFEDATEYIGTDMQDGVNVDMVINNHDILARFGSDTFDTVIACEVLEHDRRFWKTAASLQAVLKPGGYLIITTPTFMFPIHRFPKDYYRFGEDAYRDEFFDGMEILDLRHVGYMARVDCTICGIARKV